MIRSYFENTGRLGPKIDIFYAQGRVGGSLQWHYACSTQWHKTCRDAKAHYLSTRPDVNPRHVRTRFAKV